MKGFCQVTRLILTLVLVGSIASLAGTPEYHTDPACWNEPRMFHSGPIWNDLRQQITLMREEAALPQHLILSPNKVYGYLLREADHKRAGPWCAHVLIYNERPYLLTLAFDDVRQLDSLAWINEKLLFVRVWWGRIAATDLIIDVEAEKIVFAEMVQWGEIAFQQYKEQCGGRCPCP